MHVMKDCFALRGGKCSILHIKLCEENKVCGFYKTREQFQQGEAKARLRINSLKEPRRKQIIQTYYGGKLEGPRHDG